MTALTIAGNLAGAGGAAGGKGTGAAATPGTHGTHGTIGGVGGGPVTMRNSIVAANGAPNCNAVFAMASANNVSFPDASCPSATSGNPRLSPLGNNGGPTQTMTLGAGSSALGRAVTFCSGVDQRGLTRPRGTGCDAGATERSPPSAATGAASAIKARRAHVSGTGNRGGLPASYRFEFGKTKDYGHSTAAQPLPAGAATVAASLKNLSPNTNYHYRFVVTNPDGVARGEDRTFRTKQAP